MSDPQVLEVRFFEDSYFGTLKVVDINDEIFLARSDLLRILKIDPSSTFNYKNNYTVRKVDVYYLEEYTYGLQKKIYMELCVVPLNELPLFVSASTISYKKNFVEWVINCVLPKMKKKDYDTDGIISLLDEITELKKQVIMLKQERWTDDDFVAIGRLFSYTRGGITIETAACLIRMYGGSTKPEDLVTWMLKEGWLTFNGSDLAISVFACKEAYLKAAGNILNRNIEKSVITVSENGIFYLLDTFIPGWKSKAKFIDDLGKE